MRIATFLYFQSRCSQFPEFAWPKYVIPNSNINLAAPHAAARPPKLRSTTPALQKALGECRAPRAPPQSCSLTSFRDHFACSVQEYVIPNWENTLAASHPTARPPTSSRTVPALQGALREKSSTRRSPGPALRPGFFPTFFPSLVFAHEYVIPAEKTRLATQVAASHNV